MSDLTRMSYIDRAIYLVRGQRVMLDSDLAIIYGTTTKRLKEQVKRNKKRFPPDFMFHLTRQEVTYLRSQFATSSSKHGGTRYTPLAFTEHGAIMLANILHSEEALRASIAVVRAFVRFREILSLHKDLIQKLRELEQQVQGHDKKINAIFRAIHELMETPEPPRKQIGFHTKEQRARYSIAAQKK